MIQFRMTHLSGWLLSFWVGVFYSLSSVAQTFYLPERVHTPKIEIVSAQRISFQPARSQSIAWRDGDRQFFTYEEAVVLRVKTKEYRLLPFNAIPVLYIGPFKYGIRDIIYGGVHKLDVHITNLDQLSDGDPVILTTWPGGPWYSPARFQEIEPPQFRHDLIVDKRWTVFGGMIYDFVPPELVKSERVGSRAIVRVKGGEVSRVVTSNRWFWFRGGLKLSENETYTVEALINDVVLFSETITRETADYPRWTIYLRSQPSTFSEIKGYVYDAAGLPISGVRLTLDKYHRATTDEKGFYRFISLFAGTYTLTAAKEGYTFAPVELTGGNGQPVNIDLVEKNPTQCLLYAVHDTAKSEAQLLTVDFSADELAITPLGWKPSMPEISLAVGHFDADDQEEIVTAAQKGQQTITLSELNGQTILSFPTSLSGMLLAAGDLDGDGRAEIIAAERSANRNAVNVYAADSTAQEPIRLFDQNTRIAPAAGDLDGDGFDEIIGGSLLKGDQVAIYNVATQERQVFSVFQADSRLRKKATSSGKAKDCEKQGKGNQCDSVTTPEQALNETSVVSSPTSPAPSASNKAADKPSFGVQVATGDFNADGIDEIVAAMATKGSQVEIYNANGVLQNAFTAFDSQKGLVVTVGNVIGDGQPEIIVGEAKGNRIRGFSVDGFQLFEFKAIISGTVSSMAMLGCLEK